MASVVQICNFALSRVSVKKRITSLTENAEEARVCNLFYETLRDEVLSDFPWNFARASVLLAELSVDDTPGWEYTYQYPTSALTIRALTDEGGLRWYKQDRIEWGYDANPYPASPRYPFEVALASDGASRVILTDLVDAYAVVTKRVTDPNVFTPMFINALAWRLAGEVGLALEAAPALSQNALNMYEGMKSKAAALSLNEQGADPEPDAASIRARG